MPSVEATWNGKCTNRQVQKDLCQKLLRLSEVSVGKHQEFFSINVQPTIYGEPGGEEDYLISPGIFGGNKPPEKIEKVESGVYLGRRIGLYGLDFPLYDPRNYTAPFALCESNRISFVFIRSQDPELDGLLVQAFSVNQQHSLSSVASTVLGVPVLDLRYYLLDWTSKFLGWVKHFFVPDLFYWLYGKFTYYGLYKELEPTSELCESLYDCLLLEFKFHADTFTKNFLEDISAEEKMETSSDVPNVGGI